MGEQTDSATQQQQQIASVEQRLKQSGLQQKSILEQVEWIPAIWIFGSLFLAVLGCFICEFHWKTFVLAFVCYYIGGVGITTGYHRLWSHRSFDAVLPVRILLLIAGTGAFEGSVFNWCSDHRAHHRFTDTEKDPYNVNKGFWWAHMGWLLWKRDDSGMDEDAGPSSNTLVDITDLQKDKLLVIQDRYYPFFAAFFGLAVPTLVAGHFWGDWMGGFFFGAMAKSVFLQHATFFINSLAHTWGDATYSDLRSPRDSYLVSLFTFGEGYHNFHHEFPYDYRNGLEWFHYDPGKWIIRGLNYIGLTYNLKRFPSDLFHKGQIIMKQKELDKQKAQWNWGSTVDTLPSMTFQQYKSRVAEGSALIVVDGVVHDVTQFVEKHPGGRSILEKFLGLDASRAFNGKVYNHSLAARNLLATLRMANLVEDEKKSN